MEVKRSKHWSRMGLLVLATSAMVLAGCESSAMKLRNQGLSLYHQGDYQSALAKFNDALKYNPADPRANYYAGASDYMLARYQEAAFHYKTAWTVDPNYGHVKSALAEALIRAGRPNEAMNFLERDAELTGRVNGRLRVARFYKRIGDLDDARVNFAKAAAMAPSNPEVLIEVAEFYDSVGQKQDARALYIRIYQLDPVMPGLIERMQHDGVTISEALAAPLPATQPASH
ncbi:MAG: tetratricopeptide repeat protein [Phycisphaerae bacterium]